MAPPNVATPAVTPAIANTTGFAAKPANATLIPLIAKIVGPEIATILENPVTKAFVPSSIFCMPSKKSFAKSNKALAVGCITSPKEASASFALSIVVENFPNVDSDNFSIIPENCPPSLVIN